MPPAAGVQPGGPAPPQAPFQLNAQQQAEVDRVLRAWEERSAKFKRFECEFVRFTYNVFGEGQAPQFVDRGELKYAAPDKGVFRVTHTDQGGRTVPIDSSRAEHWICDGKSVYGYDFAKQELVEQRLPKELQGEAISNGPLPFLFGLEAAKLKRRYFVRITTPAEVRGQVWIEARPRFQPDAANFQKAEMILSEADMLPVALQRYMPGGTARDVYTFRDIKINATNPLDALNIFADAVFRPQLPRGWKWVVEDVPPQTQAGRPAPTRQR
jgi:TIGR03009 family protein